MLWVVAGASLFVVAFDALGSLASRRWGFSYTTLLAGSLFIYGVTGVLAADGAGALMGGVAAGIVGLVDSTIGWAVSRKLGPGRLPEEAVGAARLVGTILLVSLLAAAIGTFVASVFGTG